MFKQHFTMFCYKKSTVLESIEEAKLSLLQMFACLAIECF